MHNRWIFKLILVLTIIIFITGCSTKTEGIPLPTSAKIKAHNELNIPFPYIDKYTKNVESWVLDKDSSNRLILKVIYIDKVVITFPVNDVGFNKVNGKIILGKNTYTFTSINLNNDMTSGFITLQKN